MPFRWAEFLDLARSLHAQGATTGQEAALRSAVSRAYYAAFCHARNYARDKQGYRPSYDGRDHHNVREHYRTRRVGTRVCRGLGQLLTWRRICDYEDQADNLGAVARQAIGWAEEVIALLP
jgi:hypothetical protein